MFKSEASYLSLLPNHIITHWGTRINTSNYYCENMEVNCKINEKLEVDDAVSIKEAKKNILKNGIERYLAYIKSNFSILTIFIAKLQTKTTSFS